MPKSQNVSNMSNEASERTLDPMKHPPDSDSNPNPYIFRFDMIFFNPTRSEDLENQFRTTQSVIHWATQSLTQPCGVWRGERGSRDKRSVT